MKTMQDIFTSVQAWNAARYDREYNQELAMALLREEYKETVEAEEVVDALDGLCDTIYVALGVLWKLNIPEENWELDEAEAIKYVQGLVGPHMQPVFFIGAVIDACDYDSEYPVALAMHSIILLARAQMLAFLPEEAHIEALSIVCEANDLKSVMKTPSHIKAAVDKGDKFVSPEAKLTKLLEKYNV